MGEVRCPLLCLYEEAADAEAAGVPVTVAAVALRLGLCFRSRHRNADSLLLGI